MGEWHAYAWMLNGVDMAFPDARSTAPLTAEQAAARPILFRVAVTPAAYSTGRWRKVGVVPLPPALARPAPKFNFDRLARTFSITDDGGVTDRPATADECRPLERLAVWSPEHVESRLRDHYAGVPNRFLDSMWPADVP